MINKIKIFVSFFGVLLLLLLLLNCTESEKISQEKMFTSLSESDTGINFANNLTENDSLNYFSYSYLYMGGGVAAGDINNDGLIDVFFTGNQVSNKLYLNKGDLKFEDITEKAGVSGDERWYTGVTMGDINGDGFLDIYCSVGGKFTPKNNQLFINNQDGTFTEMAEAYKLDDIGNGVQATFLDYDRDGDLDLYVANYPPTLFTSPTFVYKYKMNNVEDVESNHLYRNDGDTFTNVTEASGLKAFGLTLSATVGDLNNDGWPDLYVSQDFNSPDFMYLNQQDGTFKEVLKEATAHTAFYGMGSDIADFNNDGNLDIFQNDMDANSNKRQKANMASMNPELFWDVVNAGFHYQYMQNCLQVNSGVFNDGVPYFSNISRLAGVSSTDWSWGPLFADFDNDGFKDLFISNGTRREINNNDYFNKLKKVKVEQDTMLKLSLEIPSEKIDNFMFKNTGDMKFERTNKDWGIEFKGFSNGVVYADLDNDGDLEIVTNNIDDNASLFKNNNANANNYITVKFQDDSKNKLGIGNRVYLKTGDNTQLQELTLSRGFQSSVAPELHFGIGKVEKIDELKVVWTDGKVQVVTNPTINKTIVLKHSDASEEKVEVATSDKLFMTDNSNLFPSYKHEENINDDFETQVLLPHKMSTFGPALAVGDLNNDNLEDYYIGASKGKKGAIFLQNENGFEASTLDFDENSEDLGATIFDADGDGDNDLYVVSGGYEYKADSKNLQDRLYLNDGKGNFTKANEGALPKMITSGSKVYHADFDGDGKEDVLVLGRQTPGNYPLPASSYLLKNNSKNGIAKFDVFTEMMPKEFTDLGMATSAVITDYNNDKMLDIIVVGEWMPIRVFKNTKTGFSDVSEELGLTVDTTGWWWSINQGDFDNDGDMDYILGNNGLNYKYKANENETFDIFVNDFDKNNKSDIVLSYYNGGKQYPVRGRGCSSQQIPSIKKKFENYETFSEATLVDIYSEQALNASLHYQVKSFASIYLENQGDKFVIHQLPVEAQVSSVNKVLIDDFDKDGALDVLLAGNLHMSEVETPRNDASYGLYLKGNNKGAFEAIPASESGFFMPGDVKDIQTIKVKGDNYIISVKNDDYVQYVKQNK
ncbi:VCBS repeat-containing protein [Aureibaculum luteum]|uniref:VCBS repeat-containing protein n=1 Tax=Aureibaculum luteum TaxID=1548456 RepID=UPI000E55348D|nr:VCBS repeat-containing protein [Aureibaculum luteum]